MSLKSSEKHLKRRDPVADSVRAGHRSALTEIIYAVLILLASSLFLACSSTASATMPYLPLASKQAPVLLTATAQPGSATAPVHLTAVPSGTTEGILPSSTPTLLQLSAQFKFCSPLAWETIPELIEIVADPYRPPPPERAEERHHGVDFSHYARKGHATILGEPVQAVLSGVVAASVTDRLPYGNMVIIETSRDELPDELVLALGLQPGASLYLLYAHLEEPPLVQLGEVVTCGQKLGTVGKTGYNIINEHLHLETRSGPTGVSFESMAFYTTTATEQEMLNYQRWRTGGEFIHFDPFNLFELWKLSDYGN